jgi:hypothetical protein
MSGILCMAGVVEKSAKNFWDKRKKVGVDKVEVWIPSVLITIEIRSVFVCESSVAQ